jgi:hypothetical protein
MKTAVLLCAVWLMCIDCPGQDLTPRAYAIVPVHSNAVILTYSYFNGGVLFDPTIPITDAQAQTSVATVSVFHTLDVFGRSASLTATQLRHKTAALGVTGRELLERRTHEHQRSGESRYTSEEFAAWRHNFGACGQATILEVQLQQRGLYSVRRRLSECLHWLAIWVAWEARLSFLFVVQIQLTNCSISGSFHVLSKSDFCGP